MAKATPPTQRLGGTSGALALVRKFFELLECRIVLTEEKAGAWGTRAIEDCEL